MESSTSVIEIHTHPEFFSRGAIEMTFALLRQNHPSLALQIRNLLSGTSVLKSSGTPASDYFQIKLDGTSIEDVIVAMTLISEEEVSDMAPDPGKLILLKTLLQEWVSLAEHLVCNQSLVKTNRKHNRED